MSNSSPHDSRGLRILKHVGALLRLPWWAVLLVVLFGTGGVAYKVYDFYQGHKGSTPTPTAFLNVEASSFPPVATNLPHGLYVNMENPTQQTVPDLSVVLDTGAGKIESCEVRSASKIVGTPGQPGPGLYSFTLQELPARGNFSVYCLTDDARSLSITLNGGSKPQGNVLAQEESFDISSLNAPQGSSFFDAVKVLLFIALIFIMGGAVWAILTILVKLVNKLTKSS